MEIRVPLQGFIRFVQDILKTDEEYLSLPYHDCIMNNFAFDDLTASYKPGLMAVHYALSPAMAWWLKYTRQ